MKIGPFIDEKSAYAGRSIMEKTGLLFSVETQNNNYYIVSDFVIFTRQQFNYLFDTVDGFSTLLKECGGIYRS